MKLFLIDKNKISKYILPEEANETFTVSYSNDLVKCFISFEGKDNKWFLKSNGNVNVFENNTEKVEAEVKICAKYDLRIVGYTEPLVAYFYNPAKQCIDLV